VSIMRSARPTLLRLGLCLGTAALAFLTYMAAAYVLTEALRS
jgi:hypothetical protein